MQGASDKTTAVPYDLDAEASVLGAILIDNDAIVKIFDKLHPEDFYDERHRYIYEAIKHLYDERKAIDVLTLSNQLKAHKQLTTIGGAAYLTELTNFVPTASHVESYAELVAEKSVRRQLMRVNKELSALAQDETKNLKDLIETAEAEMMKVGQQQTKQTVVSLETILEESFERLDALHRDKKKLRGIPTGFKDLDDMLAGLQRSDLFVLAARPSMGKAQPLDANVLTTTGWKQMGNLEIGDSLASIDGAPSIVTGIFPQGIQDIYKITFSDGRIVEASGDHLWQTHYREWETPKVLTTNEIVEKLARQRYQKRLWIDMYSGEFGSTSHLPILPWTLGLLIAEGDLNSMQLSTASPFILDRMITELGEEFTVKHAGEYDYRIIQTDDHHHPGKYEVGANPLRENLEALDLWGTHSHNKFIPEVYKNACRQDRLTLLQGLLDADGWAERLGTIRYYTASNQLADDVVELVRSLGGWASRNTKQTTYTYKGSRLLGKLCHVVNIIHASVSEDIFSLPEKRLRARQKKRVRRPVFVSIELARQAPAQCIMVSHPAHLYITNNYVVTHNTAFALNLAHNVALLAKEPVLIFSLEMSKDQLADRLLSMESGVDAWALRTGNLTDADFEKIGRALGPLGEAPIFIDDTPGITVSDVRTKSRREAHQRQLGLIIVDYLQLMSGGGKYNDGNRVQEISEISRGLKGIARELNVPLIALSQLSRSVESRPDKIPQLSDLRESGAIEQDADIVAFIYREEYYNPETERKKITDILIKKHRNGPTGAVELYFDNEHQRYRTLETKRSSETNPFAS
jgi:replicative DNA helicase